MVKSLSLDANQDYITSMLQIKIPDIQNHIYEDAIRKLAQEGVIPADESFNPNMNLNRA